MIAEDCPSAGLCCRPESRLGRLVSRRSVKRAALLRRRRVTGVQSSCPPQSELGDISQYMIALGHFVFFEPCDQIDERRLPLGTGKSTMSGCPSGALNQEMRCTGLVGALSVVLLEPEGHAEVRGLVERHDRNCDLPGQLRKSRVRLRVRLRFDAGQIATHQVLDDIVEALPAFRVMAWCAHQPQKFYAC